MRLFQELKENESERIRKVLIDYFQAYNPNDTHVYQPYCFVRTLESDIPCWSLAALIELTDECRMEKTPLDQTGEFTYSFVDDYYNIRTYEEDNPVDACYEMIIKLHELDAL